MIALAMHERVASTCNIICSDLLGNTVSSIFFLYYFFIFIPLSSFLNVQHNLSINTLTNEKHARVMPSWGIGLPLLIITKTFLSAMYTPCDTTRRTLLVSCTICAQRTDIPLCPFLIQFRSVAPRYTQHRAMDLSPVLYRRYNMCGAL